MAAYGAAWQRLRKQARKVYPPICHLCNKGIDETLKFPHPGSWSLDHLLPVKYSGGVLPPIDAVRPAHYGCNSSRKDDLLPVTPTQVPVTSRDW